MKQLTGRILAAQQAKQHSELSEARKELVGRGMRAEKVRTYNYPQNRITDHRINMTVYNLTEFMDGKIQNMIDALQLAENTERLKEGGVSA
mgnify:CR=1 FL=1